MLTKAPSLQYFKELKSLEALGDRERTQALKDALFRIFKTTDPLIAKEALDNNKTLPDKYWKMDMCWIILGSLAFPAVIIIFYLMVSKPL